MGKTLFDVLAADIRDMPLYFRLWLWYDIGRIRDAIARHL